jgi:hypothetical protein
MSKRTVGRRPAPKKRAKTKAKRVVTKTKRVRRKLLR